MKANHPAPYDKDVLIAIRALIAGKATEDQQKLGMDWIITKASNLYDMSYRPDERGGTDFHEGRRFVGSQIVKMTRPETLKALEFEKLKKTRGKPEAKND